MNFNLEYLKYFLIYFAVINIASFLSMGIDKKRSIEYRWRISEKTLFMFALFLGALGSIIGMKVFRHKTKHTHFVVGMPIILLLNAVSIFFIFKYLIII